MFIFSAQAIACYFYLSYGIPNHHLLVACISSWGFHMFIFSAQAVACYFYLSYRIPNHHLCGVVRQPVGDFMLQINLLNPGLRVFYKCFTHPLHLFTIKTMQEDGQLIALGFKESSRES